MRGDRASDDIDVFDSHQTAGIAAHAVSQLAAARARRRRA